MSLSSHPDLFPEWTDYTWKSTTDSLDDFWLEISNKLDWEKSLKFWYDLPYWYEAIYFFINEEYVYINLSWDKIKSICFFSKKWEQKIININSYSYKIKNISYWSECFSITNLSFENGKNLILKKDIKIILANYHKSNQD